MCGQAHAEVRGPLTGSPCSPSIIWVGADLPSHTWPLTFWSILPAPVFISLTVLGAWACCVHALIQVRIHRCQKERKMIHCKLICPLTMLMASLLTRLLCALAPFGTNGIVVSHWGRVEKKKSRYPSGTPLVSWFVSCFFIFSCQYYSLPWKIKNNNRNKQTKTKNQKSVPLPFKTLLISTFVLNVTCMQKVSWYFHRSLFPISL